MSVTLLQSVNKIISAVFCKKVCRCKVIKNNFATLITTSPELTKDPKKPSTTVDVADVERHTILKDDWWKPDGSMKALHAMNLIRVPFIRDGLVSPESSNTGQPLEGLKILDVGCGGGILSEPLAKLGAKVTGIDASSELIVLAEQHSKLIPAIQENLPEYIYTTAEKHVESREGYYDAVVASEVIEHVDNKELFVQSCTSMLKSGGRVFITTPSRTRLNHLGGILIAENILNLVPKGTHQYEKLTTPNEVQFLLERNKCHVEKIYGMMYNFVTNKWSFVNSKVFMFAMQAVKAS